MKALMATAAAAALLAGIAAANAQSSNPSTMNKPQTMEQPMGAAASAPQMRRPVHKRFAHMKKKRHFTGAETTGTGRVGRIGGPRNDPSIHQSIGRDSRGTPKGPGNQ